MTLKLDGQWICFIQKTPQGIVTHKFRKIDVQPWGRLLLLILTAIAGDGIMWQKEGR